MICFKIGRFISDKNRMVMAIEMSGGRPLTAIEQGAASKTSLPYSDDDPLGPRKASTKPMTQKTNFCR
jgi:hypothetical protein